MRDETGKPICFVGIKRDVTERKKAEAALRRERELLERIFNTVPLMMTLYEPSTKALRVNRARIRGMVDFYNLFNASPVLSLNTRYGSAWQRPLVVLQGRFAKFGVQVDF